ncbi:hypothetical protein [Pseudalkalibacillus sp. JSM 102089]|uniref:hypothetical protein n=1 Tax=Pseudalkalibacillus sp. JSM 102089 TaxID=3229856 RepID=UPI0035238E48
MNKEKSGELKRLNVRVRPEMYEWLKSNAESRGLTLNAMVIFAIETYYQQQTLIPQIPGMLDALKESQDDASGR